MFSCILKVFSCYFFLIIKLSSNMVRPYFPKNIRSVISHLKFISMKTVEPSNPTAGVLVIGDEILKGEVADTNSNFLANELHKLGLKLRKISVIADDLEDIRNEIKTFSNKYNYVLTTGGIGPTHDDVTYEAAALAFDEPLVLNPILQEICMKFTETHCPSGAVMKQAYIPKSAKLHFETVSGTLLKYPHVSICNVYMFPGVPELLRKIILEAGPLLFRSKEKFFTKCLYCNLPEYDIIQQLQQLVKEFPQVQIGCYPEMCHNLYKVKVTVESCREEITNRAYLRLLDLMPQGSIVDMSKV